MSIIEEYKAEIKFTQDKRIIVGKKVLKNMEVYKQNIFDHMIIAQCKYNDTTFKIDEKFYPEAIRYTSFNGTPLKKMEDSASRYSNNLLIKTADGVQIVNLNIEFDVSSFDYLFELTQVSADLLSTNEDSLTFDIYIYFYRYENVAN